MTGHNNLGFFQAKLNTQVSPQCRFCENGYETITHLMTGCERFWAQRQELFGAKTPSADMKWSVRSLIDFTYIPGINQAFEGESYEPEGGQLGHEESLPTDPD